MREAARAAPARIGKDGVIMTMVERYGRNYPCILDSALMRKLPKDCRDYLEAWDYFLFYNDDDVITLSSWDTEENFETVDALIENIRENMTEAE